MENPTVENIQEELKVEERWQHISAIEEKVLKQRSKLHWLQLGDSNNKVFHNAVKMRITINAIREIKCQSGEVVTSQEDIKVEAVRFFNDLLSFESPDIQSISVEELQELLPFRCSNEERTLLIKQVTKEEIRDVLMGMPSNKSPGPDGFTVEFFKASWNIVGEDFTTAVLLFFSKGFLPKGLNANILALVAKKDSATEMRDYRPISYCNVLYKVISKIIANRL